MSKHRRHVFLLFMGAIGLVVLGAAVGATILLSGALTTDATKQHFLLTHRILEQGLKYSVNASVDEVSAPELDSPEMKARGAACYREHCLLCHGAPGVAAEPFALGMMPVPANLTDAAMQHPPEWLYHVTRRGIRMTGMPAWEYRLSDDSLWALVAFVETLPGLDARGYREQMSATAGQRCESRLSLPASEDGPAVLLRQYACHACHQVEGVVGPDVDAAPALIDWQKRAYIAGVLPNNEDNLTRWIMDPQAVSPQTLMPDLGVAPEHARAMARFLLRKP
jgi:mono/diheme cytochrome c family protein